MNSRVGITYSAVLYILDNCNPYRKILRIDIVGWITNSSLYKIKSSIIKVILLKGEPL